MSNKHYDIVIVGGGMVGAALACALARLPINVAVLDAFRPVLDWPPKDYDLRVSAITRASQRFFQAIGAWEGMAERRITPYSDMHVWDATGSGQIHFDAAEIAEPNLGHIIENSVIQAALLHTMEQATNIDYLAPARLKSMHHDANSASLTLEDGSQIDTKLIVGADGARSWVRQQAGIDTLGWAYDQKGVVCTVKTENSHQSTAWQRFLPTGPLAFLPIEDRCSIVWSTTEEEANKLLQLSDEDFLARLNEALGDSPLGQVKETGKRAAFPLRLQHSKDYVQPRLALIGDAAHTIHPLAGQGVNLGLLDAAALFDVIENAVNKKQDVGRYDLLRKFERSRKSDNLLMMGSMDAFKKSFSNDNSLLSMGRNLGLSLTNALPPLKNEIIRHAMGLKGELPRLSRPSVVA